MGELNVRTFVDRLAAGQELAAVKAKLAKLGRREARLFDLVATDGKLWNAKGTSIIWTRVAKRLKVSKATIQRTLKRIRIALQEETMPTKPPRYCSVTGCSNFASEGSRCAQHAGERRKAEAERPSSAKRGYDRDWRARRDEHLAKHTRCVLCGGKADTVHHIRHLRAGGTHQVTNLESVCRSCHNKKHPEKGGKKP